MAFRYRDSKGRFTSKKKYESAKKRAKSRKQKLTIKREKINNFARFVLGASYVGKAQRGGTKRTKAEVHLVAPANVKRERVEKVLLVYLETGKLPRGWKIEKIIWNGKEYEQGHIQEALLNILTAGADTELTRNDEDREDQ